MCELEKKKKNFFSINVNSLELFYNKNYSNLAKICLEAIKMVTVLQSWTKVYEIFGEDECLMYMF